MGILIGELHELIFNRWAVTRSYAGYLTAIERGQVEVLLHDLTRGAGGFRHPARDLVTSRSPAGEPFARLFHVEQIGYLARIMERKKGRGYIPWLFLALTEINGGSEDTRRGTCLESLKFYSRL